VSQSLLRWEAPRRNDGVALGVCSSRPRIDECTYDWCDCETRESLVFGRRTQLQLIPRFCKRPTAQSGLAEPPSWALSKAARVELKAEEPTAHLQKIENSR
jgi:hypothetical protein